MKLRETIRYELAGQLRRPVTWLFVAVLLGLTFLFTTEAQISQAKSGDTPANAPFPLALIALFGSLFALLPIASIAGEAAGRDVQTRMTPLFYTTPAGEGTYLGGRFLAALLLSAAISLAVPFGALMAILLSDAVPAVLGPVRAQYYIGAWLGVTLPNVILAASLGFAAATRRGRSMASFIAVAGLFVASMACAMVLGLKFNQWDLAALIDPLGIAPMSAASKAWTPEAQRTELPYLTATWLKNRGIWLLVSAVVLALLHGRFRFGHRAEASGRRGDVELAGEPATMPQPFARLRMRRKFGAATHGRQLGAVLRESYRLVVVSWGGLVMLALAALTAIIGPELMEQVGVPLVPTAAKLADYFGQPGELLTIVPGLLIAYYAGELVWRDRDAGLGEIADAAPVPEWAYLLGRAGGLALGLVTFQALVVAAVVIVQLRMGHYDIEPWVHLRLFLGVQVADWLLFIAMAVVIHVLVGHKYVGHMLMIALYAFVIYASRLGVDHRLLVYTWDTGLSYTDMRGFGRSLLPWLTFELYWAAWAVLLLVAGALLWMRGPESGATARLRLARSRLTRRAAVTAAGAATLVIALGGFAFYNTNVLNAYESVEARDALRAEYERRYRRYEALPQPLLDGVRLHVELHPRRGVAHIRGSYRLVHRAAEPANSIHVVLPQSGTMGAITVDRPSAVAVSDDRHGYRVLALREPLRAGDTLRLDFTLRIGGRGFSNDGVDESVTPNGTFLRSGRLPAIGYRRSREIQDFGTRVDHALPPREEVPSLDDPTAPFAIALAGAERITVETFVSTDGSERAVAPGTLRRRWVANGRNHFHYATEQPIRNDYAIFSADYAVRSARWRDVAIEVFHHRGHDRNVDTIIAGVRASLEHLSATLIPYPYAHVRFVEHPGDGGTLHAFPINVSYEEGFRLMNSTRDHRKVDFPFAVAAHEVAHHWWGGELSPAPVEGAGLLSESLAWYSATTVVERHYGREHMERLVSIMREAYLPPRAPADLPLLRARGWFLSYRKGPLAMYALREYIGADRVAGALRTLVSGRRPGVPPLPTTRDLYRELAAATPDSMGYLVADLFAANTAWELETDSVHMRPAAAGMVELTLDIRARKLVIDTAGVEREVPMNDLVEIGAYANGEGDAPGASVYRRMHRIQSGAQRITIIVPATAAWAGVDPRNLLFDFEPGNNVQAVTGGVASKERGRARFT